MVKILLVEDSEQIWDFLSRRLQRKGHEVVLAHDGEQGVNSAKATAPDIVLLDMNLPVMDGWTAIRKKKSLRPELPVFVVTAYMLNNEEHISYEAGCDEYMTKPVNFSILARKLKKYGLG